MHSSWDSFWKTWWSAAFKVGLNSDGLLRLSRFSFFSFLLFFHPPPSLAAPKLYALRFRFSWVYPVVRCWVFTCVSLPGYRWNVGICHLPIVFGAHVPRLNCCYGRRLLPAKSCKSCKKWAVAPRPRLPGSGGARLRARVQVEIRLCR